MKTTFARLIMLKKPIMLFVFILTITFVFISCRGDASDPDPVEAPPEKTGSEVVPSADPMYARHSIKDAELIGELVLGDAEDEIGSDADNENGPESFAVIGDEVFILDSVKSRVVVKRETELRSFTLSDCIYPYHMAVSEDAIYVFDSGSGRSELLIYDKQGRINGALPFPSGVKTEEIKSIYFIGGKLRLLTHKADQYSFNEEWALDYHCDTSGDFKADKVFSINGRDISFKMEADSSVGLVRIDDKYLYVNAYVFAAETPQIESKSVFCKYDLNGNLVGSTSMEMNEVDHFSADPFFITDSGEVYIMQCVAGKVIITKPDLG